MKMVDLFLLENMNVKARSHKCYAIAKFGVAEKEHIVYVGVREEPHRVISVVRGVSMDVIDMMRAKNTVYNILKIATVVTTVIVDE